MKYVDIHLLKPHPQNAAIYGTENVDDLVQSIGESGWIRPLSITEHMLVVSGHRRYRAALQLGYAELPVDDEYVLAEHVIERLLRENENRTKTPEQQIREGMAWETIEAAKAKQRMGYESSHENIFIPETGTVRDIIARRVGLGSGVTYEKGKEVVERIDKLEKLDIFLEEAIALRSTLNEQSISAANKYLHTTRIAREEAEKRAVEKEQARVAEIQSKLEAQAKLAEIKPRVQHKPYNEWLEAQGMCDLLLTDPPYMTEKPDIETWAQEWLPCALEHLKPTGRAYIFVGAYPRELRAYLNVDLPRQILPWSYYNIGMPDYDEEEYRKNWQAILYYSGVDAPPLHFGTDPSVEPTENFSAQHINAPDGRVGNRYHLWQKSTVLAEQIIRQSTNPGDVIFDCFVGTGTFLVAAANLKRKSFGCDISQEMLDIAVKRGCIYDGGTERLP